MLLEVIGIDAGGYPGLDLIQVFELLAKKNLQQLHLPACRMVEIVIRQLHGRLHVIRISLLRQADSGNSLRCNIHGLRQPQTEPGCRIDVFREYKRRCAQVMAAWRGASVLDSVVGRGRRAGVTWCRQWLLGAKTQLNPGVVGLLFMTEISVGTTTAALFAGEPFGLREITGVILITLAGISEPIYQFWLKTPAGDNYSDAVK